MVDSNPTQFFPQLQESSDMGTIGVLQSLSTYTSQTTSPYDSNKFMYVCMYVFYFQKHIRISHSNNS